MEKIFDIINSSNTIMVNRKLAHSIGLNAAVIYASLVSKSKYYTDRNLTSDGWFYSTVEDLEESTALSGHQQTSSIKKLIDAGLIFYERRGLPAKRFFKISDNTEVLEEIMFENSKEICSDTENKKSEDCINKNAGIIASEVFNSSANNNSENSETSFAETSEPVLTKTQNLMSENVSVHYKSNINKSNTENQSINQPITQSEDKIDTIDVTNRNCYYEILKENIGYDYLCEKHKTEKEKIDEMLELMTDTISSNQSTVRICREYKPLEAVKSIFMKLNEEHIEYVLDSIKKNCTKIRNIKNYLLTAIYNSKFTISNYYQSRVNYDMYGAKAQAAI